MRFVDFEANIVDDTGKLELDYEEDAHKNFLDDSQQQQGTSLNFYRKFNNQSRKISDTLKERRDGIRKLDTRDLQPEMYWEINSDHVQFDEFKGHGKATEKF